MKSLLIINYLNNCNDILNVSWILSTFTQYLTGNLLCPESRACFSSQKLGEYNMNAYICTYNI